MRSGFDGRTVVVTGAASGIGFDMALEFRAEGALVYTADVAPDGLPDETIAVLVEITDPVSVAALIERNVADTGGIDVLCNNAGAASTSDPLSCTLEVWEHIFAVKTRAGCSSAPIRAVPDARAGVAPSSIPRQWPARWG